MGSHYPGPVHWTSVTDSPEELAAAREEGRLAAERFVVDQAPTDPLLRVAWAQGLGDSDHVRTAVATAREAGATWKQLGEALGISWETARFRFSGGYERHKRYRERKKQAGGEA